jgi:hypothetical protein
MITSFVADVLRPYHTEQFASQQERGPDVSAFGGHLVHLICNVGRERQEADMIATPTWTLEGRTFA